MSARDASRIERVRRWLTNAAANDRRRLLALPRWLRLRGKRPFAKASLIGLFGAVAGFGFNLWGMQERVCSVPLVQPGASDLCGALGLGRKPTREERKAWERLPPGDCRALEAFAGRYGGGSYQSAIAQRLLMRRTLPDPHETVFTIDPDAPGYVRQSIERFAAKAKAEAQARTLAIADAGATLCLPRDPGVTLVRSELTSFTPQCDEMSGTGFVCSADYRVRCHMRGHRLIEWCGPGKPN